MNLDLDLETSINTLKKNQQKLREQRKLKQKIDLNLLFDTAEKSQAILKRLNDQARIKQDKELHLFIQRMFDITAPLLKIAKEDLDKIPPSSSVLKKISMAFDQFKLGMENQISKENVRILRGIVGFVPLLDNVVYCCETMPYYFQNANNKEKLALILAVTFMISALVFTIASFANPALAALPMVIIVLGYIRVAKEAYKLAISSPENKYKDHKKLEGTIENLDSQVKNIKTVFKNIYKQDLKLKSRKKPSANLEQR